MSGKLLFVLSLLLLAACRVEFVSDDVNQAIADGVIMPAGTEYHVMRHETVFVQHGDIQREVSLRAHANTPIIQSIHMVSDGSIYSGAPVVPAFELGDVIHAGDVIARLPREGGTLDAVDRDRRLLALDQFDETHRMNLETRNIQILDAQTALSGSNTQNLTINALTLERLELEFQRYVRQAAHTRDGLINRLNDANALFEYEEIVAPISGVIIENQVTVMQGNSALWNWRFTIANTDILFFEVDAMAEVIRHGDVHTITGTHPDLDLVFLFDVYVANDNFTNTGMMPTHRFILRPMDDSIFDQMIYDSGLEKFDFFSNGVFTLIARDVLASDVMVLPLRAVRQERNRNYVMLYENGQMLMRFINVGVSHAGTVQVLAGLSDGQLVIFP